MGFGIELQDELGGKIDGIYDPKNLLKHLLPITDPQSSTLLACIDPYGDTVFNSLQMNRFLSEWAEISRVAHSPEQKELTSAIESLAQSCQGGVHLYLKFIGD